MQNVKCNRETPLQNEVSQMSLKLLFCTITPSIYLRAQAQGWQPLQTRPRSACKYSRGCTLVRARCFVALRDECRICKRRSVAVRVCNNACFAFTHCDRYARAAAAKNAEITKSKKDLDKIHASRCSSNCDDDAGNAKQSPKFSFSPQSATPSSVAAAPSESDFAPARAEGLHSSIDRAITIAKCFARSTRHKNSLQHTSPEVVLAEGCRVRVKVYFHIYSIQSD